MNDQTATPVIRSTSGQSRSTEGLGAWRGEDGDMPAIGQKVILFSNGVVQEEIFYLDAHDPSDFHIEYFWARDDLEECIEIKASDRWIPLPKAPNVDFSERSACGAESAAKEGSTP